MEVLNKKRLILVPTEIKTMFRMPKYNEVYLYKNNLYIKKNIKDIDSSFRAKGVDAIFNEFFCKSIMPHFNLESPEYVLINENDEYLLASKNFKDIHYKYYTLYEILHKTHFDKNNRHNSLERINAFRKLYSSDDKFKVLIENVLKVTAFDFYIHQEDRHEGNLMLMKPRLSKFRNFDLTIIYDNEWSLTSTYSDNRNLYHINNSFYCGRITDDSFIELLSIYPSGLESFRNILTINIEEQLALFKQTYSNILVSSTKEDLIKKIDLESKELVLKHLIK